MSPMRRRSAPAGSRYGACDIDSIPPPTATSRSPARTAGSIMPAARTLEAHTLLIVSEVTSLGMPASICAWREGIWPARPGAPGPSRRAATCSGATSARSSASRMAMPPSSVAGERGEAAAQLADRRAGGAEDDGRRHGRDDSLSGFRMEITATTRRPARHGRRHDRRRRLRGRGHRPRPDDGALQRAGGLRRGHGRGCASSPCTHAERPALDPGRARRPRRLRSRARADRGRGRARPRARARRARRCAGSCPTTSTTRTRARWSRARCWRRTRTARASPSRPTTTGALEALDRLRPPRRERGRPTRPRVAPRRPTRARDLAERAGERDDAGAPLGAGARAGRRRRRERRGAGPRGDRGRGHGRVRGGGARHRTPSRG